MENKPDWTQIEDEDHSEGSGDEGQVEQPQGEANKTTTSRPPGTTGTRGTGRGRGRGGRGGRGGDRGGRGGQRGGHPGFTGEQRPRDKGPKENQPKHEMVNLINRSQSHEVVINFFNVDYNASESEIRKLYPEITIGNIDHPKPGVYLLNLRQGEALKLVEAGSKQINGRDFFMRLAQQHKQVRDDQWHVVGGGFDKDNLKDDRGFNKEHKKPFIKREPREKKDEPVEIDPENKFFKGHDLNASEFKLKFTNSSSKKEEDTQGAQTSTTTTTEAKPVKSNPFGAAKARDESEYLKKREEEGKTEEKPAEPATEKAAEGLVKPPPGISGKTEEKPAQGKGKFFNSQRPEQPTTFKSGPTKKEEPKTEKPKPKETAKGNVFNMFNAAADDSEEDEDN